MKMENSIFDINMMECACIRNNNPFWRIFCWTMGYFWCIVMCQAIYIRKSEPAGREKILKLSFYSILVWFGFFFLQAPSKIGLSCIIENMYLILKWLDLTWSWSRAPSFQIYDQYKLNKLELYFFLCLFTTY
jgi:hypothetical protein